MRCRSRAPLEIIISFRLGMVKTWRGASRTLNPQINSKTRRVITRAAAFIVIYRGREVNRYVLLFARSLVKRDIVLFLVSDQNTGAISLNSIFGTMYTGEERTLKFVL